MFSLELIWLARPKILDGLKTRYSSRNGTNDHEQPRSVPFGWTRSRRVKTRRQYRSPRIVWTAVRYPEDSLRRFLLSVCCDCAVVIGRVNSKNDVCRPGGRTYMFSSSSNLADFVTVFSGALPSPRTMLTSRTFEPFSYKKMLITLGNRTHAYHAQKWTIFPPSYSHSHVTYVGQLVALRM